MAFLCRARTYLRQRVGIELWYGYTTALDHSYQKYYDPETDHLLPDNNMASRRREQTLNVYAGLNKSFWR